MRGKPDANVNEIAARTDRLTWETRIFEERVQSLTYVCEVPTLIVLAERRDAVERAARNVPWLFVETPLHSSAYQVVRNERVVMEREAVRLVQEALAP